MSWFKSLAGLLVLFLTGCGFQPMNSQYSNRPTVPEMATVKIALIDDRMGQELRNALLDRLNPKGEPERPLYVLKVSLSKGSSELGVRKDDTATRANLKATANIALSDAKGNPLLSDTVSSTASYNIMEARYATTAAERNAEQRAAIDLADMIYARVAAYFSRNKQQPNQTYRQ